MTLSSAFGGNFVENNLHQYNYYLVAYLDILGQKDHFNDIQGIPQTPEGKEKLKEALRQTEVFINHFREEFKIFFNSDEKPTGIINQLNPDQQKIFDEKTKIELKYHHFNDFIVIGVSLHTETNRCKAINSIYKALFACGSIFLQSLSEEKSIRGGIEVNTAWEMENGEIYGPALFDAYYLESKKAKYPRIVIGDRLMGYLNDTMNPTEKTEYTGHCKTMAETCIKMIGIDLDGHLILDYLGEEFRRIFTIALENTEPFPFKKTFDKAFKYVEKEQNKWREKKESDLAFGYSLLHNYFSARIPK